MGRTGSLSQKTRDNQIAVREGNATGGEQGIGRTRTQSQRTVYKKKPGEGGRQPQRHQHVDASRFSCVWSIKVVRAERNLPDPTGEKTHANKRSRQLIATRAERQQNGNLKRDENFSQPAASPGGLWFDSRIQTICLKIVIISTMNQILATYIPLLGILLYHYCIF